MEKINQIVLGNILSSTKMSRIKTILWITVTWTFITLFQFGQGFITLNQVGCDTSNINASLYLKGSIFTGIIAGIIGGSSIVYLWEGWLRSKKYYIALINIGTSYTIVYLVVSFLTSIFFIKGDSGYALTNPALWNLVIDEVFNVATILIYLFWLLVVLGTMFILIINDKFGPGILKSLITGKYFRPKREERVFMFLDLRSSTSIAEQIGEVQYFNFLNDVFKFATLGITNTEGHIYQYVGDEIVISWDINKGVEKGNCINCFFYIQKVLDDKSMYFNKKYGVIPEFKAGLHYGYVMAGEMGVLKRDIVYSGDVLNTTSRIQSKCNDLGVNILISRVLIEKIKSTISTWAFKSVGELRLKGKTFEMGLFTI